MFYCIVVKNFTSGIIAVDCTETWFVLCKRFQISLNRLIIQIFWHRLICAKIDSLHLIFVYLKTLKLRDKNKNKKCKVKLSSSVAKRLVHEWIHNIYKANNWYLINTFGNIVSDGCDGVEVENKIKTKQIDNKFTKS